jgi:hypothetical protein
LNSLIRNSKEVRKTIDFTGVQNGLMHPSDIDAVLEFDNDILILMEVKKQGIEIPVGQKLLLERISQSWHTPRSVVLKVEYLNIFKDDEDVPLDQCYVTEFYFNNKWRDTKKPVNLVMALNVLGKKWKNEKCKF